MFKVYWVAVSLFLFRILAEAQSTVAEIKCQNFICQVKKINSMLQGGRDNTEVACLLFTQQPWF